jgi:hypothetical protein
MMIALFMRLTESYSRTRMRVLTAYENERAGGRREGLVPRAGGRDVQVSGDEPMRSNLALAFEHSALLFAPVAMGWNHSARTHADEARVCAGILVAAQFADLYERVDLDPCSFACTQRASAFGRLLVGQLPNAVAHALAPREIEIRGLHAAGQCFVHGLQQHDVVGNPIFFNPRRATHIASSAWRS